MKTILLAGGTGLVGQHLKRELTANGHKVFILSRSPKKEEEYFWNPQTKEIDKTILPKIDVLVNVTGAGIGDKRWTKTRKKELHDSRIGTCEFLFSLREEMPSLKHFLSSSGVNCYGYNENDRVHEETDPYGDDYLSQLVKQWETASDLFLEVCQVTKIRTAMVIDARKGAIPTLVKPVKMGIGSALGNGDQDMPWIHAEDLASIFAFTIEKQLEGTFNAVANYATNKLFIRTMARILNKPYWFPNVPSFVIKALFGEMSEMLLKGIKVSNQKIKNCGFIFKYEHLEDALKSVLLNDTK